VHRYQIYALRILPTPMVLSDMILAYELARRSEEVVGVNVVGFEGDANALAHYAVHMRALGALGGLYPGVQLALHAGEITAREADEDALQGHVPDAFYVAGARRIGHGNAIAQSRSRDTLLEDFHFAATAVEVSLTSNELLLGLAGDEHHIKLVWDAGVPVTLNTDDAGIFGTDLSREYALAAARYPWLRYADFKKLSRQSLESAFIEGHSLWRAGVPGQSVAACARIDSPSCAAYTRPSPKASLQRALEQRLLAFERRVAAGEL
jgi:adenosine deaminase